MSRAEQPGSVARGRNRGGRIESGTTRSGVGFTLLAAVQITLILAITIITVPLPAIQRDLAPSRAALALLSAAYGLAFSGLLLLGGRLADVAGRRRVFRVGVTVFGLASAAAGIAPAFATLLAARVLEGAGAALAAPAALALLSDVFPDPDRRTRALAVWGSLAATGAIAGTLLSGVVATWVSWRWLFALPAGVAAVAALAAPRLLPPGPPPARARLDVPGALLTTGGLAALSYALLATLDHPWSSARVVVPLVGGIGLLGACILTEARVPTPLLPLSFFASGPRVVALVAVLVASSSVSTSLFILSLYFQQMHDRSPLETSSLLLPYGLVGVAGLVTGRLIERFGARTLTVAGLLLAAGGLLLLGRMDAAAAYAAPMLAGLLTFPVGIGLTFSGATVGALAGVSDHQVGVAGGIVNTALEVGPTIGFATLLSLAGLQTARLGERGLAPAAATTGGYAFALTAGAGVLALTAVATLVVARAGRYARRARCSDFIG
ncbi:MAG: MFS transporter [Sphaerobacter sp.]|nr:MFS transporter [Sphaerobacter sp.]